MSQNIKVVWICQLSSPQIREKLKFDKWSPIVLLRRLTGKMHIADYASWNIKGIREFEKFDDIELHIVAPHAYMSGVQEFSINGVFYHILEDESDRLVEFLRARFTGEIKKNYKKNSRTICKLVKEIQPDIIHLIGAENPSYGESALLLPTNIPLIVALQTLMIDPEFRLNYPISEEQYAYRSGVERRLLQRADYISFRAKRFEQVLHDEFGDSLKILDLPLAVGEDITIQDYRKSYDFIYYAADISKAVDYALEAFALAKQKYPDISLHVVGGYSESLMALLLQRIKELGIGDCVDFTGCLETFEDVINEVRKARFAVLPLKIDLISGTIRESMANGLPVVTTITPATPRLNENRESVLLSEKGDFKAMADNMCKLLENENYAKQIQQNAFITLNEKYSNAVAMRKWKDAYKAILSNEIS